MKMQKSLKVLSKATGLSKVDIHSIMREVKGNHKRLDSCSFHNFLDYNDKSKRWTCVNCLGIVDTRAKNWYEKGLKHAWNQPIEELTDPI